MSESLLKKEFKESDLQRIRNLVTKKYGEKTVTQIGYQKEIIDRKEGEIWEENDKKWTIKNGIKMSIGKLDNIKKELHIPLLCPSCNNIMNLKLDKPFYLIHNKCLNCVIEMEDKLRLEGKWEEYENKYKKESAIHFLSEMEKEIEDFLKSNETFVTEQGDIEDWGGENNQKIKQEIKDYIQNLKSKLNI